MRILLTNDDGIHAPGLEALASEFADAGEIVRVAPMTEQSGVGHGISLTQGLLVEDLSDEVGHPAFAVSGTPADCVKLALTELLDAPIDFVVSGVNWGTNVGIDIHYSGTVAAAMEGAMFGIPSMSVSLKRHGSANFAYAARAARAIFHVMLDTKAAADHVINVNVPGCAGRDIRGVRLLRHCTRAYDETFTRKPNGDGRHAYWLSGEVPVDTDTEDTDLRMLCENCITVTPLQLDITGHAELERLRSADFSGRAEQALFAGKETDE